MKTTFTSTTLGPKARVTTALFSCATLLFVQTASLAPLAQAQSMAPSEASVLSALPIAMVLAAPSIIIGSGVVLTVVAVEASARGTIWILERASDGVRLSLEFIGASVVALGTAVVITAVSTGWILSNASRALAFVPNEIGAALLYNERITR